MTDDFEDRLRRWGALETTAAGQHPPLTPAHRRRWQPFAAAAAVVALVAGVAVAVAAQGGSRTTVPVNGPTSTPSASSLPAADVPWADLSAGPIEAPTPSPTPQPSGRACSADDLTLTFAGGDGATGGQLLQYVTVADRSSTPCLLDAPVTAVSALVNGHREVVPPYTRDWAPHYEAGLIGPGHDGRLTLSYNVVCEGYASPPPTRTYTDVRVTVYGVALPVQHGQFTFCDQMMGVSRLGVVPGEPVYPHDPRTDLVASVAAPASVRAGDTLRYVVTLSNPTSADIVLEPCPSFVENTFGSKGVHRLNCAAAHPVPAGGQESFAMELPIRADELTDQTSLHWALSLSRAGLTDPFSSSVPLTVVDGVDPMAGHTACTPERTDVPCASGMVRGTEYPYLLYTHCGLRSLYADGRYWVPIHGPIDDGAGNPPEGYTNPEDAGFVTLPKPGVLNYRAQHRLETIWVPGAAPTVLCS